MSYLVDSDVLIDALRGRAATASLLARLAPVGLSISIVSLGEIFEGATRAGSSEEHAQTLRQFLDGYKVIGLSEESMRVFGRVRATLRQQGNLIPDMDLLIASTALRHNLTLITRNLRHFERIDGLKIYAGNAG